MWHIAGNWSTKRHLKFYIIYKDRTVLQIQPITTSCCRFNLSPYYAADSTYHHIMLQIQPITTLCCRLNLSPYYAADSTYHHTTLQIRPFTRSCCRFKLSPHHAADSTFYHIMLQIQPIKLFRYWTDHLINETHLVTNSPAVETKLTLHQCYVSSFYVFF